MAFSVDCTLKGYEVRGVGGGVSKKGNEYKTIRLEGQDGYTCEVSVTDPQLFGVVGTLKKGTVVNVDVRAVANQKTSFLSLLRAPVLVADDAEIGY